MRPPSKKARRANGSGGAPGSSGAGSELQRALAWLNSYPKVSRWMERYDVEAMLDQAGGLCQVADFLPPFVAEGALQILQRLPPGRWRPTEADQDYSHNNIAHAFWSVKGGAGGEGDEGEALEALLRAFTLLRPGQFHAFSAARYDRGHHIAAHDDRAYTPVQLETGELVTCSRELACIFYLTKDWTEDMGGALVDLEADPDGTEQQPAAGEEGRGRGGGGVAGCSGGGKAHVPLFNSAVFFRVPRYHVVTPLTTDRPRYSVFGWFLQPGKLYDLFTGDEAAEQAAQQQQQQHLEAALAEEDGGSTGQQQHQLEAPQGEEDEEAAGQPAEDLPPPGKRAKKQRRQRQGGEGAPACKLAQRLLARLANQSGGRRRREASPE